MKRLIRAYQWWCNYSWVSMVGLFLGLTIDDTGEAVLIGCVALIMIGKYLDVARQRDEAREIQLRIVAGAAETHSQSLQKIDELKDLLVTEKQHSLHLQTRCIALSSQIHSLIRPVDPP